jgi:hypothetical protein
MTRQRTATQKQGKEASTLTAAMTRGNQREIDRARAEARHAGKGTAKEGDYLLRKVSLL